MLKTQNIYYHVGKKQILNGISAEFHPGEFIMILGPNGSGKSSFLKIFSGELNKFDGTVLYDDRKIGHLKKEELARYRAVMSQQPELSFPLTVEEVVMMGRYPHFAFNPNKKDRTICDEVIERMNLDLFRERNYLTLSGGEKQRVQFARVLAQIWEKPNNGCRYLFLDEPLASLDISYQLEFLQLAREFSKADTVLVAILHDINLALSFASRILFMKEGKIVHETSDPGNLTPAIIKDIFDVEATIIRPGNGERPVIVF